MAADLSIIIKAVDQASGTINGVQQELGGLEKGAGRLGGILKGGLMVGAGVAVAGIGALGAVLGSSVKEAAAAEEVTAQLNAVLKSTGGAAGMTAAALEEQALALSKVTRFEDDAILKGNAVMLTFTKIGADIFPRATQATLDLSTAFGMDLQSATMMVGKALNDPVAGLTALSRAGVQFTTDQKEMIKAMVEAGDVAGAQALILKELETQIGGSAVAAGQTMTGQMEIMKNALGNVKEEIGNALIPVITNLLTQMGPGFIAAAQGFANWFVNTGMPALQKFGNFIVNDVFPVLDRFGKWFEVSILPHLASFAGFIITDAIPALQAFGGWISENVFPVLAELAEWLGPALGGILQGLSNLFEGVTMAVSGTIAVFQTVINWARNALAAISDAMAALNAFLGMDRSGGGSSYGGTPTGKPGGAGYGSTPTGPSGAPGYGSTPTRSMAGASGFNFQITINAPGGNPQAVAVAAQQGVMAAARSMGLA
jgi:hypothetical protein